MEELRRCLKVNAGDDIVGQKQYLQSIFRRWDNTGRGILSKNGFKQAITPLRTRIRDSDIDEWFIQFGAPGGFLDCKAFIENITRRSVTSNSTSLGVGAGAKLTQEQKYALVKEFRAAVARRGGLSGMASLGRAFRLYDTDRSQKLDKKEFMAGLQNFGLNLSSQTAGELMSCFDIDNDGLLDLTEFCRGVRGGMNEMRQNLVRQAFSILDRDGSGIVTMDEVARCYNAKAHPYVLDGRMTEAQVVQDFMRQWDGIEKDNQITIREFIEYYENVSTSIDRDDYFELMIRNAWHMAGGSGVSANTSNARVLVTDPDGSQRVVCIEKDLGLDLQDVAEVNRRLQAQGETGRYMGGGNNGKGKNTQQAAKKSGGYIPSFSQSQSQGRAPQAARTRDIQFGSAPAAEPQGEFTGSCLEAFRKQVMAHGGSNGIRTIASIFRRLDDNRNKKLDAEELGEGLAEWGMRMTKQDLAVLVAAMDRTGSGSVNFDDFLVAVRGGMSAARKVLVEKAFALLDRDGSGIVDFKDMASAYDTKAHPDVIAGKKTERDVLNEFMANFEKRGTVDGKITKQEFMAYYNDVSSNVDRDDYFELMMRNAWHMSGGQGASANTSCLRVLVIFTDGSQKVVEIQNDLGLSKTDMGGIRSRLRAQGVTNIAKIRLS
jgi:Ca2+-binding EF-hand superfamily protein